jgi:pentatricopeptide repeat protein
MILPLNLVQSYANKGVLLSALEIFSEMISIGIKPDQISL